MDIINDEYFGDLVVEKFEEADGVPIYEFRKKDLVQVTSFNCQLELYLYVDVCISKIQRKLFQDFIDHQDLYKPKILDAFLKYYSDIYKQDFENSDLFEEWEKLNIKTKEELLMHIRPFYLLIEGSSFIFNFHFDLDPERGIAVKIINKEISETGSIGDM